MKMLKKNKKQGKVRYLKKEALSRFTINEKAVIQLDWVLAIGFFILIFAFLINFTTDYFESFQESLTTSHLKSEARILLNSIVNRGFMPSGWDGSGTLERIGLETTAYKFMLLVNNSEAYLKTGNVTNHTEKVVINYTDMGFETVDPDSTYIVDSNGGVVGYDVSGDTVEFDVLVDVNETKWFTIYFDDDSNFTHTNIGVSGVDNLTEIIYPIQELSVIAYEKMKDINQSDYDTIKNTVDIERNFHIRLYDTSGNLLSNILDFDADDTDSNIPGSTDVVAYERYIVYQNSSAGISNGTIVVYVW